VKRIAVVLLAIGILGGAASAAPIIYVETTTASGTLGSTHFTNALVTVTLTSDTSTVTALQTFLINPGIATVKISGLPLATLTGPTVIGSTFNDTTTLGMSGVIIAQLDSGGSSFTGIVGQFGPVFLGYSLQGFGPISGSGGPASGSHIASFFPTTAGDLGFAVGSPSVDSTFVATVVPEPAGATLLATGLLGLACLRLRSKRA